MKPDTLVTKLGRNPALSNGSVNPALYQTSTIIFETYEAYLAAEDNKARGYEHLGTAANSDFSYSVMGTATTFELAHAIAELERGEDGPPTTGYVTSSGLAAISVTLMALVKSGDHLLLADTVYGPTRRFCREQLSKRFGVIVEYFDPTSVDDLLAKLRPETAVVFLESPGSVTLEVQDVQGITSALRERGSEAVVVMDNTWASPLYFKPFQHGVDVSIQAATKYISGHSDLVMGIIVARTEIAQEKIFPFFLHSGHGGRPYDCWLALRGMRTMAIRMKRHQESALRIARWLDQQPLVDRVLYPAFEKDPGHEIWKRDFTGASGLLSVVFRKRYSTAELAHLVNGFECFGIGASWGGFESLVMPCDDWLKAARSVNRWSSDQSLVRLHIGLEDPEDLLKDLEAGLARLSGAEVG